MREEKTKQLTFYPMHMHLHASHEPSASIGTHMSRALALGIKHIWLTEHDSRMGQKGRTPLSSFRFQEDALFMESVRAGFAEEESGGTYAFEQSENGFTLHMQAQENQTESLLFHSKGKRHCDALFSRLTISMNADMVLVNTHASIHVELILSAQPPAYEQARMCYVLGEMPAQKQPFVQYLPMPKKENGVYRFPITKDVSGAIGGLDNAFCNVRLTVTNGAKLSFRSFTFDRELNFEQVRQEQIKLAKSLGEKWGVTPFVAFEISSAGHHKNCYSTKVPVLDYIGENFHIGNEQAIAHVKAHGGIFSWNHPFTETSGKGLPMEERIAIVERVAEQLTQTRVYGATLMEVGFPHGRDGFRIEHYARLWDRLAQNGVLITGDGDSDNHHAMDEGWIMGNNFCTFAGIYPHEPPTEESFVKAFKRGSVWMGDPVLMRKLTFSSKDQTMGSVLVGKRALVRFASTDIQCDGYARCIVNGEEVKRIPIKDGKVNGKFWLSDKQKYNFARVELYSAEDRAIALTNPIYLVANAKDIPLEAIENGRVQV